MRGGVKCTPDDAFVLTAYLTEKPGFMRETEHDAVMERVDEEGHLLGFSLMNVSRISREKPLVAELMAKGV